jgi:hypothetical protein
MVVTRSIESRSSHQPKHNILELKMRGVIIYNWRILMIYIWFTGINYYKLAVEKDRDSIFTTIKTIWKPMQAYNKHCKFIVYKLRLKLEYDALQ